MQKTLLGGMVIPQPQFSQFFLDRSCWTFMCVMSSLWHDGSHYHRARLAIPAANVTSGKRTDSITYNRCVYTGRRRYASNSHGDEALLPYYWTARSTYLSRGAQSFFGLKRPKGHSKVNMS